MTGTSSSGTASGITAPSMIAMRSETSRQHEPQRNAQSGGNGLEQFGGCFLLPALNFGEIAQGHLCFGGDFAQGSTLALADATQDIAQFAAQQRSFAQCLSISLL